MNPPQILTYYTPEFVEGLMKEQYRLVDKLTGVIAENVELKRQYELAIENIASLKVLKNELQTELMKLE